MWVHSRPIDGRGWICLNAGDYVLGRYVWLCLWVGLRAYVGSGGWAHPVEFAVPRLELRFHPLERLGCGARE